MDRDRNTQATPLPDARGVPGGASAAGATPELDSPPVQSDAAPGGLAWPQAVWGVRDHAIITLDADGVITGWNPGAAAIFGLSPDEAVGRHAGAVLTEPGLDDGSCRAELLAAAADGVVTIERWLVHRDGTRVWARGTLTAQRDRADRPSGFVAILHDRTAENRLADELERARVRADQVERSRDHFIAMISHELRTPLSIIMMWSKMLREDVLEGEDLEEAAEAIARSAETQSRLIEDLLDSSRIAAGTFGLKIGPADLGEVVAQVVAAFRPAIESARIECVTEIDDRVGVVECDAGRVRQVVRNLISNAVKFTPGGGRIEVTVRRESEQVTLTVGDNGAGIGEDFLPRLFERFSQDAPPAGSSPNQPRAGLGLGLSIVRSIVEMHGGSVTPFSDGPGTGARFVVQLPLRAPEGVRPDAGSAPPSV